MNKIISIIIISICLIQHVTCAEFLKNGATVTAEQSMKLKEVGNFSIDVESTRKAFVSFREQIDFALKNNESPLDKPLLDVNFLNDYDLRCAITFQELKYDSDMGGEDHDLYFKIYDEHRIQISVLVGVVRQKVADCKFQKNQSSIFCENLNDFKDDKDRPMTEIERSSLRQYLVEFRDIVQSNDYEKFTREISNSAIFSSRPADEWVEKEIEIYSAMGKKLKPISQWIKDHPDKLSFSYFPIGRIRIVPTVKNSGWRRLILEIDQWSGKLGFMNCD